MKNQIFVIGLDMENKSAEEIARDVVVRIVEITDDLYQRQKEAEQTSKRGYMNEHRLRDCQILKTEKERTEHH